MPPVFDVVHTPVLPKLTQVKSTFHLHQALSDAQLFLNLSEIQVIPITGHLGPKKSVWVGRTKETGFGGSDAPEKQVRARAGAAGGAGGEVGEAGHTTGFARGCGDARGRGCSRGGDGAREKPKPLPRQ